MAEHSPLIMLALVGNLAHDRSASVKYGLFHAALETVYGPVETFDATLRGFPRLLNALQMFHPKPWMWRERFWKNVPAFKTRSQLAANAVRAGHGQVDVVLQLGVLFNAGLFQSSVPLIVYTDYTAGLSAARPEAGRSPFTLKQRAAWMSLEQQTYACADHVFTRSELVRRSIIDDYNIEADKVTVVGGGVNFATLPEPASRSENEAPLVLFIGKEFHRKGGDVLIKAFAQARQKFPLARLRLVTQGPIPSDLPLDHVEVIPPTWDRDAVAKLFQAANIFVLPSRLETWGDVLLEAMAWELPCIGVQSDAMNEIVLDGETGLLVPSGDVNALAEALMELFRQPSLRVSMGLEGRQRVDMEFTWDHVVMRMKKVLDHIKL
jgi:glycosyltransferase involved in cell wall biosynthesis